MHQNHDQHERRMRRTVFDQVARRYDEIRPTYPAAMIADIIDLAALPPTGRILEIGCGTGQATLPFAERGYRLTCVELGPELAAITMAKCAAYPNVQVVNMAFEDWPIEPQAYDLVMSATAFHWIPPDIGYPKAAQLLKDSGSLAIFSNEHPTPFTGFFDAVQAVYQQVVPEWRHPNTEPSTEAAIESTTAAINRLGLFAPVAVRTYRWSRSYTAEEYIKLLNTYSDHLLLAEQKRKRLHDGIQALIEDEYGGTITKPYLTILYIAKKRAQS